LLLQVVVVVAVLLLVVAVLVAISLRQDFLRLLVLH
jgi:hypothetical protein